MTPSDIPLAALCMIGAVSVLGWLQRLIERRRYPLDQDCSDFTEPHRPCPFGCGCMGRNHTNEGA